jgi:hypothetical protein
MMVVTEMRWTLTQLAAHQRRIVFDCHACNTITVVAPDSLFLKGSTPLMSLDRFYPCPECGHCNDEGEDLLAIQAVE